MSILIKGMEMPTSCESCPCKTADAFGGLGCQATGYIPLRKANQDRPDGCPIVPVPPHGRLIDADALSAKLNTMLSMAFGEGNTAFHFAYRSLGKMVENAPTIIPAEEGET